VAEPSRDGRPPRVAYLSTTYPAPSHAFIEREVTALRARGVELHTFAIRPTPAGQLLTQRDREAAATTTTLLPVPARRLVAGHWNELARRPRPYGSTLLHAVSIGRGARRRLWQTFYFAEAVLLARACNRTGIEHIHAHFGHPPGDVAMLAARLAGVPWSLTLHGTDVNRGDRRLLAAKAGEAAFVVCVGHFARNQLLPLVEPAQRPRLHVVRCGLENRWFEPPGRASARNGHLRVLSVARLDYPKEPDVLIEAIARLRRSGRPVELTVVGDGALRPRLEQRVRELQLSEDVVFAGFVGQDDLPRYYGSADVFCLSSASEGVPVVLMEAMASGVPVVAPRLPGVEELVEDERAGLLFEPGDAEGLARSVERLGSDPRLVDRLTAAARAKVEAEFRVERSAADLEQLFLDARRAAASSR
jgi:glycosyltransferase involved in cell wall biosynthesis